MLNERMNRCHVLVFTKSFLCTVHHVMLMRAAASYCKYAVSFLTDHHERYDHFTLTCLTHYM